MKRWKVDMACRVLIVEDEFLVATEIEYVVSELGHRPVGIAADQATAISLAPMAEVALVDLNLRDGPTGKDIGRMLAAEHGITVLYMTANPAQLGDGVPGTVGVISKPVADHEMKQAVNYAVARRRTLDAEPPERLTLFA
ncbi:response regulator [Ensifer adhaerens]